MLILYYYYLVNIGHSVQPIDRRHYRRRLLNTQNSTRDLNLMNQGLARPVTGHKRGGQDVRPLIH